jgi:predicted porin
MNARKLILMGATWGLASVTAQAQSIEQLQQAIAQAQAAAAQAQAAAKQAQAALEQALAAADKSKQSATSVTEAVAKAPSAEGSLTVSNGKSSATLYGLIDVTISSANNKDATGGRLTGFQTGWFSGSRWGISGSHDLSFGGLKAIARLESEFVTATGEQDTAGVIFNRDAWAGLQSEDLGKLSFGRQNALGRDFAAIYMDPYGAAKSSLEEGGGSNTNNFKHLIYYGGSAAGTRMNSGVVWKKAFSSGVVAGAAYAFGGVTGNTSEASTVSAAVGYNGGVFNVAGFATQARLNGLTDNAYSVGGNVTAGDWRFNAGYFRYSADQGALGTRTDNAYTVSVKFAPAGRMDYEFGYQNMKADNGALKSGVVANAFASVAGLTAVGSGNRSTVYGSLFYHFDKSTEVYFAADYLKMDAGYGTVNGSDNQTEVAIGLRTRF